MTRKTDYLVKEIRGLDDEAFTKVLDKVTDKATDIEDKPKDGTVHLIDLAGDLKDIKANRGKFRGFSTGLTQLDAKMGGLEAGSVTLIAGETSHGKSALVTNIAMHLSRVDRQNIGVLYISLEMTQRQMLERLDLVGNSETLPAMDLVFQESFALSYRDLEPLVRKARQKHDVKVVVIDYLQYLGRGMTLDEVARMSKEVKAIALRYGVAMLVITSVRKGSAEAKFRRKWTDIETEEIMGSSAIAYDADTIIVVSRKDDINHEFDDGHIYIKVLKTRNSRMDYHDRIIKLDWDQTRITEKMKAVI